MTASPETTSPPNPSSSSRGNWLLALVVSLAAALAIISPYFWKGNASGHDFSFHAASWMEVAGQWRDGMLYPRWADGANFGFGEPRFIFYPPLSWMFGALLSFVVPWLYVPAVFIVLTQTMAGLSAFALGRRLFPKERPFYARFLCGKSICAVIVYAQRFQGATGAGFLSGCDYYRTGTHGCCAIAFRKAEPPYRFSVRCFCRGVADERSCRGHRQLWTGGFLYVESNFCKIVPPALYGAAGLALGFGLIGFYLLPAAYEQRWVNISQALASGLQPAQNFSLCVIADEDTTLSTVSLPRRGTYDGAYGNFCLGSISRDKKSCSEPLTRAIWNTLLVLAIIAVFMMLRVSGIFWTLLPKLRFVQFPWRWMSLLAIPFACFIAATIARKTMRQYSGRDVWPPY